MVEHGIVVKIVPIAVLMLMLNACAELPKKFHYNTTQEDAERAVIVWPEAGDVPRFAYIGELLGEPNFRTDSSHSYGLGQRALAWISGLELGSSEKPVLLQRPQGGTADASGRIYVSDVSRQAVFVFDTDSGELLLWEWADDSRRFRSPVGVAVRGDGEVLVADAELGRVVRLSAEGQPLGALGSAELKRPTGLAVDSRDGNIYVADTQDNAIKVFDGQGRLQREFGSGGNEDAQLNSPTYLTVSGGKVYVTDTLNARVQIYNTQGHLLQTIGERGLYIGNLTRPKGVAVSDDGLIYIVESYYDHLLIYDDQGRFLLPLGGAGAAPGQFSLPAGVWIDRKGRVYVSDMLNGRVSVFQFLGADT